MTYIPPFFFSNLGLFNALPQLETSYVFRHACQTPLTTLLSATDYAVKSTQRQSEHKTYLMLAKNAAQRLFELFALLDQPKTNKTFRLIEAIYEVATLISPRKADLRIVIDQPIQTHSPRLLGNRLYFTESLICLLNNAHEAAPKSTSVPLIILAVYMKDNRYVQFDIIDTGPGMRVVSPTQIVLRRKSTKRHGRGVGRWFAYQVLTQLFHGQVIVSSSCHGTRVSVNLPIHKKNNRKNDASLNSWRTDLSVSEFFSRIRQVKWPWAEPSPLPILPR